MINVGVAQDVVEVEVRPGVVAVKPVMSNASLIYATIVCIMFYVVFGIYGYMNYVP